MTTSRTPSSSSSSESPGRERAIEMLMDMEPQGPLFRAARLLDETVPQALLGRPNLITKQALVDKAYSLADAEVDTVREYQKVFGIHKESIEDPNNEFSEEEKNRIWKHYERIIQATRRPVAPSLDALLEGVFGEELIDWRGLVKEDESSSSSSSSSLENRLQNACRDPSVSSLLVAALSVLESMPCFQEAASLKQSDGRLAAPNSAAAALQAGSILALLPTNGQALDRELLEYLGKAAAVLEERLGIMEERLTPTVDAAPSSITESSSIEEQPPAPTVIQPDVDADDDIDNGSDDDSEATREYQALEPLEDRDGDSSSSSDDSEGEFLDRLQDDDDDDDEDYNEEEEIDDEDEDSDDDMISGDDDEQAEAIDDHDVEHEEDMLREALALSLEDHAAVFEEGVAAEEDANQQRDHVENARGSDEEQDEVEEAVNLAVADETVMGDENNENLPILAGFRVEEDSLDEEAQSSVEGLRSPDLTAEAPASPEPELESDVAVDEPVLPPLPDPPSVYPYEVTLEVVNDPDLDTLDHDGVNTSFGDPSAFSRFGALPSSRVVMHLLDSTLRLVQERQFDDAAEIGSSSSVRSFPGGTGSSLFPPRSLPQASLETSTSGSDLDVTIAVRLLVASVIILTDKRAQAVENLRVAMSQDDTNEPEDDCDNPLPNEEDPALTVAMSHVEDSTSPTESFEALETKGMKRKAAAAAHDAAIRLKRIQKESKAWKEQVRFLSQCTVHALQCLRIYLQSDVMTWLSQRHLAVCDRKAPLTNYCDVLPSPAKSKLSHALDSLMSRKLFEYRSTLLVGDDTNEVSEVLLSLPLYKESLMTWGEAFPLIHSDPDAREKALVAYLEERLAGPPITPIDLGSIVEFPTSEMDTRSYKFQLLCRRLVVSDLLNGLVPHPLPCILRNPEIVKPVGLTDPARILTEESHRASALVKLISSTSSSVEGREALEVWRLYRAVCHRCNIQMLLWNGLYSCSQDDVAVARIPSHAANMSTTGSVRINTNPTDTLVFDSSKCSDSIAVLSNVGGAGSSGNGFSALQRASKVWGTVLSTTSFSPKSGVHRWAIRLDKCERGHVFVGVTTAQATLRTYVGGDKYGWGVIGTQALWHDRRKTRGDYGATFRTGATIIVTLDTDAGTLSFSSWKDNGTNTSFSVDPLFQTLASPRRQGQDGSGTVEDWGVAFEGLPLDSRLFPAVGLYQRDDRVTLLSVESGREMSSDIDMLGGGTCFYPSLTESEIISHRNLLQTKTHNDLLSWDGVQYCTQALSLLSESLRASGHLQQSPAFELGQSVASALSMIPPTIPVLSRRFALYVLPYLSRCIQGACAASAKEEGQLFAGGLLDGKWIIRATGSGGNTKSAEYEEYIVTFSETRNEASRLGFQGSGVGTIGKSKNGVVNIFGSLQGSSLHFVEEWKDGFEVGRVGSSEDTSSSCVINARLNLDGTSFEGSYRNVQYGTTGHISGMLSDPMVVAQKGSIDNQLANCIALLCLAHGHLACIIGEDSAGDLLNSDHERIRNEIPVPHRSKLNALAKSPILSSGIDSAEKLRDSVAFIENFYGPPQSLSKVEERDRPYSVLDEILMKESATERTLTMRIASLDEDLKPISGGEGSLAILCKKEFSASRLNIISVILHHCGLSNSVSQNMDEDTFDSNKSTLVSIWRVALKILDDRVRRCLSESKVGKSLHVAAQSACEACDRISSFLLEIEAPREPPLSAAHLIPALSEFYSILDGDHDLNYLRKEMERAQRRALLLLISLYHLCGTLMGEDKTHSRSLLVENLAVSVPRLLGRNCTSTDSAGVEVSDLGGHYLSQLSGSGSTSREAIKRAVYQILQRLGHSLEHFVGQGQCFASASLSILAAFALSIRPEDSAPVIDGSGLLPALSSILSSCRKDIRSAVDAPDAESSKLAAVHELYDILLRDTSRLLLRTGISVAHILTFQVSQQMSLPMATKKNGNQAVFEACLRLFFKEMDSALPFVESIVQEIILSYEEKEAENELDRFVASNEHLGLPRKQPNRKSYSGLQFFRKYGSSPYAVGRSRSRQKKIGRPEDITTEGKTPRRAEMLQSSFEPACHHYVSQLLHLLGSVVRPQSSSALLSKNVDWLSILLKAAGLSCKFNKDDDHFVETRIRSPPNSYPLPERYRTRILRLLACVLPAFQADKVLVEGLFRLAGAFHPVFTGEVDRDESLVSRETVSLLRHLYCPLYPDWRREIHGVLMGVLPAGQSCISDIKVGRLAFLSGSVPTIEQGAFVLLKPAAASSLTNDSSTSSKIHGSSGHMPSAGIPASCLSHHVVGNGTAYIVAGLCRDEASAGIVSSVDEKTGMCEVILLDRHRAQATDESSDTKYLESVATRLSSGGDKVPGTNRFTLTVRAIRTALSDVSVAEEVPVFLGPELPTKEYLGFLPKELQFISSNGNSDDDAEAARSSDGSLRASMALMSLRTAIVLVSDERILRNFLESLSSAETLANVLTHASLDGSDAMFFEGLSENPCSESLSPISHHEARFNALLSMLRDLDFRGSLLDKTPAQFWHGLLKSYIAQGSDEPEKEGPPTEAKEEDISTPPPVGTASDAAQQRVSSNASGIEGPASRSLRDTSQGTVGSSSTVGDEESEAAATAAAHLREAAIAQMAELGLPRAWSELALRRTGGTNIEAAVHFCLERGGDMERLLAEERERERMMQRQISGGPSAAARRRSSREGSAASHLLQQLLEMGFPSRWCAEALAATGNNVDEALTWILANGERLSAEDDGMEDEEGDVEEADDVEDSEDDEDETEAAERFRDDEGGLSDELPAAGEVEAAETPQEQAKIDDGDEVIPETTNDAKGWWGSVTPLRFVSGRSNIDPHTMTVSGLPSGGFSSVGTKGVMLTSGKWYYEAILETAGCLQIGWADGSYSGHCSADRGDGCGDGPSSWAYDGWRRYRWHAGATEWGCRWKEGDVVGCLVDMDEHIVSFTLNGRGQEIGMGVAFSGLGFRPCGGVYACVSFNRREKLRLILGGKTSEPFKHQPPLGYRGVGEAVLERVEELDRLLSKEDILTSGAPATIIEADSKKFLCDFSDGEHGHELFAWQHRYYGSDASVHLGSGRRPKQATDSSKQSNSADSSLNNMLPTPCLTSCIDSEWTNSDTVLQVSSTDEDVAVAGVVSGMRKAYNRVRRKLKAELSRECRRLCILYSRKFILHLMVTMGDDLRLQTFIPTQRLEDSRELDAAKQLWKVVSSCVNLQAAGWVGEAGAMAVSAEALGLGISSTDHHQLRGAAPDRTGGLLRNETPVILPYPGVSQLLSTVLRIDLNASTLGSAQDTGISLAACAEASLGGFGGGGPFVFLKRSLQSAVSRSRIFQDLVIAVIRQSVRLLAVVEFAKDDALPSDGSENFDMDVSASLFDRASRSRDTDDHHAPLSYQPDARLISFLTGLLLSAPVQDGIEEKTSILSPLFEVWSIGMLSASMPWRMISAHHAAGILTLCPEVLPPALKESPSLARFYGRLKSSVARRVWAERAAVPVCSHYVQAMIELLASVKHAVESTNISEPSFVELWNKISVDSATPLPLSKDSSLRVRPGQKFSWEWEEGWVSNDSVWEVWLGSVECMPVDWIAPSKSAVRSLMDGGDGPPMLREGCMVMRGLDWNENRNEDGKDTYEAEKDAREKRKQAEKEQEEKASAIEESQQVEDSQLDPASQEGAEAAVMPTPEKDDRTAETAPQPPSEKKKKRKKLLSPKLPVGTVVAIEPWNGVPAMGRRVKWKRTGVEGVYRYGGDGGRYDLSHVEINDKATRVKKRHPLPESLEQIAVRHGFGAGHRYSVILRLRRNGVSADDEEVLSVHEGILEWPDFGAGIRVECVLHKDGAVSLTEQDLIYGSKDSGWEARFGQPSFVSGSVMVLSPTKSMKSRAEMDARSSHLSAYEELLGSNSFCVETLRNRADGGKMRVTSEMRLYRTYHVATDIESTAASPVASPLPPLQFDREYHASSISLSRNGRTVTCTTSDGRCSAFGSTGFTKGVHYWEVKIESGDIGSVFVGVAEKPNGAAGSTTYNALRGEDSQSRLNRWLGIGFVNFRATFASGAERVYGAHCHSGDTIGVLLDCDAGRVSYFFDGLKYGEHILNDLGCAFENISPFGFGADGCGSGGAGQGAPSGAEGGRGGRYPANGSIRPRALWPIVGLRTPGDRVTFSSKWVTSFSIDGHATLKNVLALDSILSAYSIADAHVQQKEKSICELPGWFVKEAFLEYRRWYSGKWHRSETRGCGPFQIASFGLDVDFDTSPIACAAACAGLGLKEALLPGDRVSIKRSAGRLLELAEEAVILGAYQGRLYYRIVSQKSEGGSLSEGGGRAWFWDESEVVDNGLQPVNELRGLGVELPLLDRFKCTSSGGLKIVYNNGAVIRTDLEIIDGSSSIGTVPFETVIHKDDVLERRVNSCGVIRYRIRYNELEGWISSSIRGGMEEIIVEPVQTEQSAEENAEGFKTPMQSAIVWFGKYREELAHRALSEGDMDLSDELAIQDAEQFKELLDEAIFPGLSVSDSDSLLVMAASAIADFTKGGDPVNCTFTDMSATLSKLSKAPDSSSSALSPGAYEAGAAVLVDVRDRLPPTRALLARIAMLRALNRRASVALPWISARPCQEGSAIFGGLFGNGSSVERAGRNSQAALVNEWFRAPSISSKIRVLRGLFFSSVKRTFLNSIINATATPTPLSHDEYELPREIRTVRVNRLKARRAMEGNDDRLKRKNSVFSQLHSEMRTWAGAALRRGFVAKGHGGQKRAFKVKFISEGVNDYSGPYREAFTDAMHEVLDIDSNGRGSLGVLDPTPNNASEIGDNRGLFMFSTANADLFDKQTTTTALVTSEERRIRAVFASLLLPRGEASREVEESLFFLGRLAGTACRHGIPVELPLPMKSVWKAITEEDTTNEEKLEELDLLASRLLLQNFEFEPLLLSWQQRMLNSFVDGLSNVLPGEALSLMTGAELRDFMCGNTDVDVDLLRRVVEYEGFKETDDVITYFWEVLREMSSASRKKFLQFVWARNTLPMKESDFEAPFKIQRDATASSDDALPSASTCFFSLSLPNYSSKETLKQKLLFAIENVTTMESDYVTNDAEISEGWRGL